MLLLAAPRVLELCHAHAKGAIAVAHLHGSLPLCLGSATWLPTPQSWHQAGRRADRLQRMKCKILCAAIGLNLCPRASHQIVLGYTFDKAGCVCVQHVYAVLSAHSALCCGLTWCCTSFCGLCVGAPLPDAKGNLCPCSCSKHWVTCTRQLCGTGASTGQYTGVACSSFK